MSGERSSASLYIGDSPRKRFWAAMRIGILGDTHGMPEELIADLRLAQWQEMLSRVRRVIPAKIFATPAVPLAAYASANAAMIWVWALCVSIAGACVLLLSKRASDRFKTKAPSTWRAEAIACVVAVLYASAWSYVLELSATSNELLERTILGAVLGALAMSAPLLVAPVPRVAIAYSVALVSVASIVLPTETDAQRIALTLALLIYFGLAIYVICQQFLEFLLKRLTRYDLERQHTLVSMLLSNFETHSGDWLWETDSDCALTRLSDQYARRLGRGEWRPTPGATLCSLFDAPADSDAVRTALKRMRPFRDLILRGATDSGEPVHWRVSGAPRHDSTGAFLGFHGLGADVTEHERIIRELEEARVAAEAALIAKSRFIAAMSHELRTPLNAVIGFAELIATATPKSPIVERIPEFARDIEASGRHLLAVINDVLELASLDSGLKLRETVFSLRELLDSVRRMTEPHATPSNVTLAFAPTPAAYLYGDERRLRQSLLNLVVNAIKYGGAEKTVTIDCEIDAEQIRINVRDQGPGLSPAEIARIFEPFTQLGDDTASSARSGVGLGLTITKGFVQAHGGAVTFTSLRGAGACATITLSADRLRRDRGDTAMRAL